MRKGDSKKNQYVVDGLLVTCETSPSIDARDDANADDERSRVGNLWNVGDGTMAFPHDWCLW